MRDVVRAQREAQPVRFTIAASGDLLIHSLVWERALALGGDTTTSRPLFDAIEPYVAGADLALCHVETPMTPAPPASYPIFNTPPELARGIRATGLDACDTASNHSLDQAQTGIDETGRALDRAGVEHTGSFPSAGRAAQAGDRRRPRRRGRLAGLHHGHERDPGASPVVGQHRQPGARAGRRAPGAADGRRGGDRQPPLGRRDRPRVPARAQLRAARPGHQAHRIAPDHGDRRAGPARRAADPADQRQVRRLQRGQPGLEPEPGGGAARVEPGRPDRAARLRRQERRGRGARSPLRAGVRQPPRLPGAADRRRA